MSQRNREGILPNTNPNPLTPLTSKYQHFLFMKKIITPSNFNPLEILFQQSVPPYTKWVSKWQSVASRQFSHTDQNVIIIGRIETLTFLPYLEAWLFLYTCTGCPKVCYKLSVHNAKGHTICHVFCFLRDTLYILLAKRAYQVQ